MVGDVITLDTKNCLIFGDKRLLSTIGLEDCLIVETDDAVLIAKKGEAWKVKDLVNRLKEKQRKEASEHLTTYRPWVVHDSRTRFEVQDQAGRRQPGRKTEPPETCSPL